MSSQVEGMRVLWRGRERPLMMGGMELSEIIKQRRAELNMSQSELAEKVGVDKRQIRRYEAGETQPTLPIAKAIANALSMTIDQLAGEDAHRVGLTGQWWASWQTFRNGVEKIASQQVEIKQEGTFMRIATVTRGLSEEEGGYHWSGELRLWDNEILMGWYAARDGSVRSKGTMYFVLHPHGLNMSGRWVGLGYDGKIMTGWASMGQTREQSEDAMARLVESGGMPYVSD
jgi:transcriptional regulator with XRE-family HTH domain